MAEFCLNCWNKLNDSHDTEADFKFTKELDLCEGCGEYHHLVIAQRYRTLWSTLWDILPFRKKF